MSNSNKRPSYPPLSELIYHFYRVLVVCTATFFIHHCVIGTIFVPLTFNVVKSNFFQNYVLKSRIVQLWINLPFLSNKLAENGQTVDDMMMYIVGSNIIHVLLYVCVNSFFIACDVFGWFQYYRIPHKKWPSAQLLRKTIIDAVIGFVVAAPIGMSIAFVYVTKHWKGFDSVEAMHAQWTDNKTPFYTQIGWFVLAWFGNEIGLYLVHRLIHEDPFYRLIHRQHHIFLEDTISISAEYLNPIETVFGAFIPISMVLATNSKVVPISAWFSWFFIRLIETYDSHSAFDFRFDCFLYDIGILHGSAAHHVFHHTANKGNFGGFITDWFGGSMDLYLQDPRRLKAPCEIAYEERMKKQ
jgi:sterol desaturase/sphingolipid hydroxylase (fatty acid hydroxylase superfamily)